jgi:hypothetical protein
MSDLVSMIQQSVNPPSPFENIGGLSGGPTTPSTNAFPKLGFLDHVLYALTGTPDSMLPPDKVAARHHEEQQASQAAVAAYENPGESYMGPPVVGGSKGFDLGSLFKLFAGAGGL